MTLWYEVAVVLSHNLGIISPLKARGGRARAGGGRVGGGHVAPWRAIYLCCRDGEERRGAAAVEAAVVGVIFYPGSRCCWLLAGGGIASLGLGLRLF